ncbi:MAG: twin-arginine translocase subunit TatC [bacterium]
MTDETKGTKRKSNTTPEMSFWDHLEEFRSRLIKSILFMAGGFCAAYFFIPYLQDFLIDSFFRVESAPLAFLKPTEGFIVRLKLALFIGLILTTPAVFYQFWQFVSPGLLQKEKKFIIPIVVTSSLSFLTGIVISYFSLPYATRFFLSFGTGNIENIWSFGSYVDFVIRIMLAFGIVFELPLIIYFLVRLGIVTPQFLRNKRRHAIIICLVVAAVITPPDIFTMIMLSIPLILLYEISIIVSTVTYKKHYRENP